MHWVTARLSGIAGPTTIGEARQWAARFAVALVAVTGLGLLVGLRPVVEYSDLTCPVGSAVRYAGVAHTSVYCGPAEGSTELRSVPLQRYVGLFLTNANVRLLEVEFGVVRGPALGVRSDR